MIRGAIFDLDGTLLDSMGVWDTVGSDYLRFLGYEPKGDINALFRTFTLHQAAEHYRQAYGVPMTVEELMNGINQTIAQAYCHTLQLKPGVQAFLQELAARQVRMCIATATDRPLVEAALRRLGILHHFADILTCTEIGCSKEDPTIYRMALECLGTTRQDTPVFEDAPHALKTAKADGFTTIGVYDDHQPEQAEVRANSDVYLPALMDMQTFWFLAEQM